MSVSVSGRTMFRLGSSSLRPDTDSRFEFTASIDGVSVHRNDSCSLKLSRPSSIGLEEEWTWNIEYQSKGKKKTK
jgi:hypothetical protein